MIRGYIRGIGPNDLVLNPLQKKLQIPAEPVSLGRMIGHTKTVKNDMQ